MPPKSPGFLQSASYVVKGWRLVRQPGLRRFVLFPLLVNLLVFGGIGWWVSAWATDWLDSLGLFSRWGDWWIVQALQTVLNWLVSVILVFSLAFVFTLLANLIGAPFNGLLAERVEAYLTGKGTGPSPSWLTLINSLPRLMGSEIRKLLYLLICILPLLLLQFIPLINLLAPVLLFLFGAWMFALEYMDYPLGNHGALFKEVRQTMRARRRAAYGFGTAVAVISMIPIANLFIMPVAVAGATALYVDSFQDTTSST